MAKILMVQGTTSDAGKSTLVAALCRIFANKACTVAPFKPQNMALNSAVTHDGGEIGRAQALQAQAARVAPSVHMNPVLLKPASDIGSQIIIQGKALGNMAANTYHQYKPIAKQAVLDSFAVLQHTHNYVFVEGAGSPAEINLREGDIANMGFAEAVDCPVVLIADIDKGGVFAHLVGTLELLAPSEQARVKGFIINKFRGDIALLKPGLEWLENKTHIPVLGVLPYFKDFYLDAEDALNAQQVLSKQGEKLTVVVPVLPRISNHTDFDTLRLHPEVELIYCALSQTPPPCDLLILPGSKNVIADLKQLQAQQWPQYIAKHLRYGGKLLGICGGLQMLGRHIHDPHGIEGKPQSHPGLNLLNIHSTLGENKTLVQKQGQLQLLGQQAAIAGYEIHHGQSTLPFDTCIAYQDGSTDGLLSEDQQIFASYLHGLFDQAEALQLLLKWAGLSSACPLNIADIREQQLERLARETEQHLDMPKLHAILERST